MLVSFHSTSGKIKTLSTTSYPEFDMTKSSTPSPAKFLTQVASPNANQHNGNEQAMLRSNITDVTRLFDCKSMPVLRLVLVYTDSSCNDKLTNKPLPFPPPQVVNSLPSQLSWLFVTSHSRIITLSQSIVRRNFSTLHTIFFVVYFNSTRHERPNEN